MSKQYIDCDLDGVLCEETPTFDRPLAKPIKEQIQALNRLYNSGWGIIIHTARGWSEYNITKKWLDDNQIWYDILVCGKPVAKYRVDDRSFKSVEELCQHLKSA